MAAAAPARHHAHAAADEKVEACIVKLKAWREAAEAGSAPEAGTLSPAARAFLREASTLRRFAVARNGDYGAALKGLLATIAWRDANIPDTLHCRACDADPHMHAFFPIGVDDGGRVVVYACAARAKTNDLEVTVGHMVQSLEFAFRASSALALHHQWVWVIDFTGFSFWHAMQGSTSNATLQTFADHFPERLGSVLLLNPPGLFDILLGLVKAVADSRTMAKVKILRCTPDTAGEALAAHGIPAGSGMAAYVAEALRLPGKPGHLPPTDGLDQEHLKALVMPRLPV
jgi:hypothetical protein